MRRVDIQTAVVAVMPSAKNENPSGVTIVSNGDHNVVRSKSVTCR